MDICKFVFMRQMLERILYFEYFHEENFANICVKEKCFPLATFKAYSHKSHKILGTGRSCSSMCYFKRFYEGLKSGKLRLKK